MTQKRKPKRRRPQQVELQPVLVLHQYLLTEGWTRGAIAEGTWYWVPPETLNENSMLLTAADAAKLCYPEAYENFWKRFSVEQGWEIVYEPGLWRKAYTDDKDTTKFVYLPFELVVENWFKNAKS
jgi:hypothetical protein